MFIMENIPGGENKKINVSFELEKLKVLIEEMKRRLNEQKNFEPGEKEMYEKKIREGEIYLINPGSHKN